MHPWCNFLTGPPSPPFPLNLLYAKLKWYMSLLDVFGIRHLRAGVSTGYIVALNVHDYSEFIDITTTVFEKYGWYI